MSSTLCDLFTPFQYRVGIGHGFDDFQKSTFGTLKTIPVDGVELARLMMAMQSIEKKFDCDTKKFFKTPEKWIKLEQKLRKIYYADNQDEAGYERFLQHHMKNRAQRKVFGSIDLQLRDVVNVDEYDDKLTLREFVECIGIQELRDPMNFVRLLRAVAIVSSNTIDFSIPFYIHMTIMLFPVHAFFMENDVSSFVPLLRADLREPPYLHYETDPAKDKYPRNESDGTGRDAHSPSPDQIEIILLLMRRPYNSNRPQEFTQNLNRKTKVSTVDTKNKMKAFIAQIQSSSAASFILVSGESCRIDMMKLQEIKEWLRTMYYTRMDDLQKRKLPLAEKMEMKTQIMRSFRGGFDNLAVPEVGLKIIKAMFPERTANPDPKNSGNSNIHVPLSAGNSMNSGPQNSTRPLIMGNSNSRNFNGVGSHFSNSSGLPARASQKFSVWAPSNHHSTGGRNSGGSNDNGSPFAHVPGSQAHASHHSSTWVQSNHQWTGSPNSGGSDDVGNSLAHVPGSSAHSSYHSSWVPFNNQSTESRNSGGSNENGSPFAYVPGSPDQTSSHTSTWVPSNHQWSWNHTESSNDVGPYAPGSPAHATPHSYNAAPSNHQWNDYHHPGGSYDVGSPFTGNPGLAAHASPQTSTSNPTDPMSGNCIPASTYNAEYARAVAFFQSGAWSPTNLFVMQPDPEWERIHKEFNIPM